MTILRRVTDLMYRHATEHAGEFPTHVLMTPHRWDDYREEMRRDSPEMALGINDDYPSVNGLPVIYLAADEWPTLAVANLTGEK